MFRAILPEGQIHCDRYELNENGAELYTESDEFIAFVPFENLHALLHETIYDREERTVM